MYMKGLTEKQLRVTHFIREYICAHGYSPSYREIQKYFQFASLSSVFDHLQALKKKEALTFDKQSRRSISLNESKDEIEVSLIGLLKEGVGLELFHDSKGVVLPRQMIPHPDYSYALKVVGTFLQEEMIDDGDLIVVETRDEAEDGETVLLSIGGMVLIKKIFHEDDHLLLASRMSRVDPIVMKRSSVEVQGVVMTVIRSC